RRRAGGLHLVDEDVLLDRRLPHAAEFLRPAHAPPSLLEQPAMERLRERTVTFVAGLAKLRPQGLGDVRLAERPHLVPPGELLGSEIVPPALRVEYAKRSGPARQRDTHCASRGLTVGFRSCDVRVPLRRPPARRPGSARSRRTAQSPGRCAARTRDVG